MIEAASHSKLCWQDALASAGRATLRLAVAGLFALAVGGVGRSYAQTRPAAAKPPEFREIALPSSERCAAEGGHSCVGPAGLLFGPDGNLWFGMQFGAKGRGGVARIATDGSGYTEFSEGLSKGSSILHLALASDGNIWFTDWGAHSIGRITPQGVITTFDSLVPGRSMLPPSPMARSLEAETIAMPYEIVAAPGGDLWYTVQDIYGGLRSNFLTGYVGRFSPGDPTGTLRTYPLSGTPSGITVGPDGAIWVIHFDRWTDKKGGGVTRITAAGEMKTYPLPLREDAAQGGFCAMTTAELTFGPDGNIWFTQEVCPEIGRLSPATGKFDFFKVAPNGEPTHLVMLSSAKDGYVYVGDSLGGSYKFWRVSPEGQIDLIEGTSRRNGLWPVIEGPDGNLWFSHRFSDVIGTLKISAAKQRNPK